MKINNIAINYIQYGNKSGKNIVLLHGWGQNTEMMDPVGKRLQEDFYITNIDLPGFGKSEEPPYGYTIYDYYEVVDALLKKLKIETPIIIGHSFGGRIAIIYSAKKTVDKLVLLSTPFKRSEKKKTIKVKILKIMKNIPIVNQLEDYMKTKIGSNDYKSATPIMRKVLVNTVNEDLTEYLKQIKASTILIGGTLDTAVKEKELKYAEGIMKDAGLVLYEDATHYAYLERIDQTVKVIKKFLEN